MADLAAESAEVLDRLDAAGGPDDTTEHTLAELNAAVAELDAAWTPRRREARIDAAWRAVQSARATVRTEGLTALGDLRDAIEAFRDALGQPPAPRRNLPLAHKNAFTDAKPPQYLSTDLETLDRFTLGGLWAERFAVIAGEPNVGKTALATQIASVACESSWAVAIHAADVDRRPDIAARMGVRRGVDRAKLRDCDTVAQKKVRDLLEPWHLKIADQLIDDVTIEDTIANLLELGQRVRAGRLLLIVDSLQTALSVAHVGPGAPRFDKDRIDATAQVLLRAASRGILVLATSEMPRNFYSGRAIDQPSDMAAVKGSGRLEFAVWTLMVLRRLRDAEANEFHLGVPKNKGGQPEGAIKLRYVSDLGTFADAGEVPYQTKKADQRKKAEEDPAAFRARIEQFAEKLVPFVIRELAGAGAKGLSLRQLRERLNGKNAARDRAMTLAVERDAAVLRRVRGYERYFIPSAAPPEPAPP